MIRLLLVEDQTLVLGALAALLNLEEDLEVCGQAANTEQALALVASEQPDVVITDIEMPGNDGLTLAARLKRDAPDIRVIVLTTFARPGYLKRAQEAGVCAYLLKDGRAEALADAVRRVCKGERIIDPALAAEAWQSRDPLSERERHCLRLAGEGHSNKEIAKRVHLSEGTVRNYLSQAMNKLDADNRIEAFNRARELGYL
ncbi:response regulator transcription factor [Gammaproteobacteria bacterium AB-CW1]|uniref:Response regulator transcription factor n=1 Tax=Natronospira elongata TaxID=3110268 RepID=A0AAP6JGP1_9GAMM|nr:response regulator transcription factor [Gammaproteobacteria bacterium AB-CW1]